jgi:hypothetical protein
MVQSYRVAMYEKNFILKKEIWKNRLIGEKSTKYGTNVQNNVKIGCKLAEKMF